MAKRKITVQVITEHLMHESLTATLPREYEYEEIAEDYNGDTGTIVFTVDTDNIDEIKRSLDANDGVISYSVD